MNELNRERVGARQILQRHQIRRLQPEEVERIAGVGFEDELIGDVRREGDRMSLGAHRLRNVVTDHGLILERKWIEGGRDSGWQTSLTLH